MESTTPSPKARPLWMDALFAAAIGLGFGLSLMRTPTTWLWAVILFVVGSVGYGFLRVRWARRHPRPTRQRTSDGVWFMALFLVAFALSGVRAPEQWLVAYGLGAGLLVGGTGLVLLRRQESWLTSEGYARDQGPTAS